MLVVIFDIRQYYDILDFNEAADGVFFMKNAFEYLHVTTRTVHVKQKKMSLA
jgi:hypothetical protein